MNLNKKHIEEDTLFAYSKEFLSAIINKQLPAVNVIEKLYGSHMSPVIIELLATFLDHYSSEFGTPRKHFDSPLEIRSRRCELETDISYNKIHADITSFCLPSIESLQPLYGEYSIHVYRHYEQCFDLQLIRKCGLSIAAHHNRVGAIVRKLNLETSNPFKYASIGAMHDTIEELLNFSIDENNLKYGINRYQEFVEELIPEKIRNEVYLLTNHYDLILKQIKNDFYHRELAFTKGNLISELENILKSNVSALRYYFEQLLSLIQYLELDTNFYVNIKWLCYQNYIREMAIAAKETSNYKIYIIKAVDLLDNCFASDALEQDGKIKNILKLGIWAKQGYELSTTHSLANNCVMEIYEEALHHSESIIIKNLLEDESKLDGLAVALNIILKLKSILFTDIPLSPKKL